MKSNPDWTRRNSPQPKSAFTLLELLVVAGLIAALAGLLLPALSQAKARASSIQCMSNLRQLGLAVTLYADDHDGMPPRSQHSAAAYRQRTWGHAVAPYVGVETGLATFRSGVYRCRSNSGSQTWSYGLNVYFELDPEVDSYRGAPRHWRRLDRIPRPAETLLFGELQSDVDHIMAHFWDDGGIPEVSTNRHRGRSNYGFVDGHAAALPFSATYHPPHERDWWNPFRP